MILLDIESETNIAQADVHKSEIISFTVTYDHTMLITCSRDTTSKLLHPRTFEVIKIFEYVKPCRAASISPLFD